MNKRSVNITAEEVVWIKGLFQVVDKAVTEPYRDTLEHLRVGENLLDDEEILSAATLLSFLTTLMYASKKNSDERQATLVYHLGYKFFELIHGTDQYNTLSRQVIEHAHRVNNAV